MILTKGYQQIVDFDPVLAREYISQGPFSFIRRLCRNIAPAVADTVDMGINANPRLAETERHHQIGGLAPYPLEFQKLIDFIRDSIAILVHQALRDIEYLGRLVAVKTGRIDQAGDFFNRQVLHLAGRPGPFEQPVRSQSRDIVLGPQRDQTRHQHLEGTATTLCNNGHGGSLPRTVLLAQDCDGSMDISGIHLKRVPQHRLSRKRGFTFRYFDVMMPA